MATQVRTAPRQQQQRPRPSAQHQPQQRQRTARASAASQARPFNLPFEQKNITIILIGCGIVTLGYVLMAISDLMGVLALNVSPVVLLIGYVVVIPFGIMIGAHKKNAEVAAQEVPLAQQ